MCVCVCVCVFVEHDRQTCYGPDRKRLPRYVSKFIELCTPSGDYLANYHSAMWIPLQ